MLKIDDLHVSYGAIEALKGISINIKEGEIVTLIGANGAGKTTTLRTISGLEKSVAGKIIFQGENITNMEPHKIVELGIAHVPEGRRVFANMSVFDNLRLGANLRNDEKGIKEDFEKVYTFFQYCTRGKINLQEH